MHLCSYAAISFFFLVAHLNEMHLDIHNFIMPCNNISLCDGKQAMRGHALGEEGFFFFFDTALQRRSATWRSGGVPEQDFSLSSVQHRCDAMDTRPPLVKPRCPCFIRHPTGSPALLISVFRQLAPRPSSIGRWPPVLKESSSLQIFP